MGIKGLFELSHNGKKIKDIAESLDNKKLKGKKLCIDASWQIYSSYYASRALSGNDFDDSSFLYMLINIIHKYHRLGVNQFWVFDNPQRNIMKQDEINKRLERRKTLSKKNVQQFVLNAYYIGIAQSLLKFLNIKYITAPVGFEAEHFGSVLCKKNICCGIISGDSDVLAFGGNLIRKENKNWKFYNIKKILDEFDLTNEEFVTICIALGSDFSKKVKLVGPKTAIKKLKAGLIKLDEEQQKVKEYFLKDIDGSYIDEQFKDDDDGDKYSMENFIDFLKEYELDTINVKNKINLILHNNKN
jgi:flap endonuclease-1